MKKYIGLVYSEKNKKISAHSQSYSTLTEAVEWLTPMSKNQPGCKYFVAEAIHEVMVPPPVIVAPVMVPYIDPEDKPVLNTDTSLDRPDRSHVSDELPPMAHQPKIGNGFFQVVDDYKNF